MGSHIHQQYDIPLSQKKKSEGKNTFSPNELCLGVDWFISM